MNERNFIYRLVTSLPVSQVEFKIEAATSPHHYIILTQIVPLSTLTEPIKIVFTPIQAVSDYLTNFTQLNFCNSRTTWYINPNISIVNQIENISLFGLERGKFEFFNMTNNPLPVSIILTSNINLLFP